MVEDSWFVLLRVPMDSEDVVDLSVVWALRCGWLECLEVLSMLAWACLGG